MRKWITPFAFVDDDGALNVCCDRVLERCGLPVTEDNIRLAERILLKWGEARNQAEANQASPPDAYLTDLQMIQANLPILLDLARKEEAPFEQPAEREPGSEG